jgi:hypothetical protein
MIIIDRVITISDKNGLTFTASLVGSANDITAVLSIFSKKFDLKDVEGEDFFECLIKLRQILEKKNLLILCQGSAENVYPSRMARDMSRGLKAYSLEIGRKITEKQLVDIFDPAPVERIASVLAQKAFFQKWLSIPRY